VALQIEALAMWLAMALYAGATVLYAYFFLSKKASYSRYATLLTGAGWIFHTASIGLRSSAAAGSRLWGPYSLVLAAWALILVYFVVEHLVKLKVYGTVLVPLGLLLLIVAQLAGAGKPSGTPPLEDLRLLESWRVAVHVVLIVFANAGFAIGAVASGAYLVLEAQLKSHRTSTFFKRLPSLAQTDQIARRAVAWAYPVYAAGLMLGVVRAMENDVAGWWADPRVMLAGLVMVAFGAYLYLHYGRNTSGRTTAFVALAGLVIVVALAIVARTLPSGFHIFGVGGS
jgi:ABC-type transport system involved in cytochrome c biogenesis permease subunit